MFAFVLGAIVGGALLGLVAMMLTTPALVAYRSSQGVEHTLRRDARDAWLAAYLVGVVAYTLLHVSGVIGS